MATRVLFVDDDPGIRETFPAILSKHGFDVTVTATVGQALAEITAHKFDVLIADLNIGQPGDGFTVVSAMRRTQPDCVTFILTGYPALETALQAIRSQVDDYLIKPAEVAHVVAAVHSRLISPARQRVALTKRVADILNDNTAEIIGRVLRQMQEHPAIGSLPISDTECVESLPVLIAALAGQLQSAVPNNVPDEVMDAAASRGVMRRQQGYDLTMLVEQIRLFERVIFDVVHENLFCLNLSYLMIDLKRLNDSLGLQLQQTILAFVEETEKAA